ncbi:MAG: 4-phosphoerythronate dehydrogenase, partial [Duncaniella sp.]|nr:4-phosphoerythronate dehydrogenase [Duncaniella sp.]
DHIDLDYCRENGITTDNDTGCNAQAVAQWVLAAVKTTLAPGQSLSDKTLGVIGAGNVGSILIRWARGLGMKVLVNDPPLEEAGSREYDFTSLDRIAEEADVITIHTPLVKDGSHPTFHLIGEEFISKLKRNPMVLNAARGEVADTIALKNGLRNGLISSVGIDCWEGEPKPDSELLEMALIATPHIAGYSREGKIRATEMVLKALSDYLGLDKPLQADAPTLAPVAQSISEDSIDYDILADTALLKKNPDRFEDLRNGYDLRKEP